MPFSTEDFRITSADLPQEPAFIEDDFARGADALEKVTPGLREWAAKNPNTYGVIGAVTGTALKIGDFASDVLPENWLAAMDSRFADPATRANFQQLSKGEQTRALGLEMLFLGMLTPTGSKLAWEATKLPFKLTGKAAGAVGSRIGAAKPLQRLTPIEDSAEWMLSNYKQTTYQESFAKAAKKFGVKRENEVSALAAAANGDNLALRDALFSADRPASKSFAKLIDWEGGRAYGQPKINAEAAAKLLDAEGMRKRDLIKAYKGRLASGDLMKGEITQRGKSLSDEMINAALKANAERFLGKSAAREISLSSVTEDQLFNFLNDVSTPYGRAAVIESYKPFALSMIKPVRFVYSKGEQAFGTFSKVYEPIKEALGMKNAQTMRLSTMLNEKLVELGLVTKTEGMGGIPVFKPTKLFSPEVAESANGVLSQMDEIMEAARSGGADAIGPAREQISAILAKLGGAQSPHGKAVAGVVNSWMEFADKLYAERFVWKVPQVVSRMGLNAEGATGLDRLRTLMQPVQDLFMTGAQGHAVDKLATVRNFLQEAREQIQPGWFKAPAKLGAEAAAEFQKKQYQKALAELTLSDDGGKFMGYLENYMPRVYQQTDGVVSRVFDSLSGKHSAFYTKNRHLAQPERQLETLQNRVNARVRAQANEMYFSDTLEDVAKYASGLPTGYRNYTEHYVARLMNMPSRADVWVADALTNTVGRIERFIGAPGVWDGRRVMDLAKDINDATYMGFLGLKPFSAARNLFQPLLSVPADLGGLKSYKDLALGYAKTFDPKVRKYLQDIGIITEYLPENVYLTDVIAAPKGFKRAAVDNTRAVTMWMFRSSDILNRYVTGAAALNKWERVAKQFNLVDGAGLTGDALKKFSKTSGASRRISAERAKIEGLVSIGKHEEAKKQFIHSVVGDTQFLYGYTDSPLYTQSAGAVGKMASVFQSWWMNYGALISKWLRTGETIPDKAYTMAQWMLSNAIAYHTLKGIWDEKRAMRDTFFGPFPDAGQNFVPPAFKVIGQGMITLARVAQLAPALVGGQVNWGAPGREAKQLMLQTAQFAPGGMQIGASIKGYSKEGLPGVLKSITGIQR